MKKSYRQDIIRLLVLNIIFCCSFFYAILGALNTSLISLGGDGLKNYFCYLYFIRYDRGVHFTGMNYPFGENILFTDNTPALAWCINQLKGWFPWVADHSLLLLHSTILIAYALCSWYLYKIFRRYGVRGWWAACASVFIAYFSPQFFRVLGHFSLSLTCFFPMIIYWFMCYQQSRKSKYLIFFFLLATLFTFLHVYYLAFSLIFACAFGTAFVITQRVSWKQKLRIILPPLLSALAVIAVFKGFLLLTDPVTDRTQSPYGFLNGVTKPIDILTSDYNFIGANAFSWLFGRATGASEGYIYPGITAILVCLFLIFRLISGAVRRVRKATVPAHPVRSFRLWLVTALIMLLFGMGIPFMWFPDALLDHLSLLKQFRSLGRFSWAFYYLIMVYSGIFLYRLYLYWGRRKYRKLQVALVVVIVPVFLIEWNGYGQQIRPECVHAKENYQRYMVDHGTSWIAWLKEKGYTPGSFQGQIGLPFTHIGSDRVTAQDDAGSTIFHGSGLAYATGLNMVDVMMSRTSWSQTFALMQLVDGPYTPKPVVNQFGDKPFLVFVSPGAPLTLGEKALISQAAYIGKKDVLEVYALDMQAMVRHDLHEVDSLKALAGRLPQQEGLIGDTTGGIFAYSNHFDQSSYAQSFAGKGAMPAADTMDQLLTISVKGQIRDSLYTLSSWFRCDSHVIDMPYGIFRTYDQQGVQLTESDYVPARSTYVIGDWYKAEREFVLNPRTATIKVWIKGSRKNYLALDELLLYPVAYTHYYKPGGQVLLLNNRPLPIP